MKELIDCFSICFQGKAITWNILTLQLQKNNSLDETKILVFKIFLLKGFHNTYLSEYLLSCFVFVFWITSGMLSVHWFKHSHNLTPMQMYCIRIYLVIDFQIKQAHHNIICFRSLLLSVGYWNCTFIQTWTIDMARHPLLYNGHSKYKIGVFSLWIRILNKNVN